MPGTSKLTLPTSKPSICVLGGGTVPKSGARMNPEYVRPDSEVGKCGWKWKQMGNEEKKAAINDEMKRMQRLPPNSSYVCHRMRVLSKIQQLLSLRRTTSQEEELELLFSGLHI